MQANASTNTLSINLLDLGLRRIAAKLKIIGLISLLIAPLHSAAQDEEDWWFDVEVIAFKRNTANTRLEEDFKSAAYTASSENATDLITLSLFQRLNSLVYIQSALLECSLDSNLYTSELFTPENNPIAVPEVFVPEAETLKSAIPNSFPTDAPISGVMEDEQSNIEDVYSPIDDVLTPEQRFAIMFDPNNCSAKKQELAEKFITFDTLNKTPVYLGKQKVEQSNASHLLADEQLVLLDFAKKLSSQRDISPLTHIAWRQKVVFGEENASYYRVYAGEKLKLPTPETAPYEVLKEKYDPELNDIIDQNSETFFAELKQQLDEAKPVNWDNQAAKQQTESNETSTIDDVWELDGRVKVFLNYINRVPYLHIESEFQFHEIQLNSFGEAEIEQYPFKQRRRIVSKQIHYFDHPKIGLVIRLQRYEKPKEEINEDIY